MIRVLLTLVALFAIDSTIAQSINNGLGISNSNISSFAGNVVYEANKSKQGSVDSCGFEFVAFINDWSYYQGQKFRLNGSFGVGRGANNSSLGTLKVITQKVDNMGNALGNPEKPFFAYLKNDNGVNNSKSFIKSFDTELPGGILVAFNFDSLTQELLLGAITDNKIAIAFNRRKNGQDIEVPLDLTVVSLDKNLNKVISPRVVDSFRSCILSFMNAK